MIKNIVNFIIVSACILICFILQSSVLPYLKVAGVSPNLMIVLVASLSFQTGERSGLFIGLFSGLLCDVFFGPIIGFNGLVMAFIGYLSGKLKRLLYAEDFFFPMILVAGCDMVYGFLNFIFLFLMRNRMILREFFLQYMLPETIYTVIISLALYPLFAWIYDRFLRIRRSVPLDGRPQEILFHR